MATQGRVPGIVSVNTNQSNEYPPEEWRMVRQLVRLIASAKTWQDMVEASDAIFQVQLRAGGMKSERAVQISAAQSAQGQCNQSPGVVSSY